MTIQQLLEVEEQQICPIPYPISDSETRAKINWARAGVVPVVIESTKPMPGRMVTMPEGRIKPGCHRLE